MNRALLGGLIALGLGLAPAPGSAFCRTATCGRDCIFDAATSCAVDGKPIAWAGSCVSYSVHRDGTPSISQEQLRQAAGAAFRAWQETTCPLSGKPPTIAVRDEFGAAVCGRVEYNARQANANVIVMRETWDGDKNVLALTTVTSNRETGEIYDVDMEVNATQPLSVGAIVSGRFDLQSILTHEVGHFLGLSHSQVAEATMFRTYMAGTDGIRSLDADDIAGICTIYPPERIAPVCDPTPRRGFTPECRLDPAIGGACSLAISSAIAAPRALPALALGLGIAVARRRTRRRRQKLT